MNLSELASHFRLYNYFIKSGANFVKEKLEEKQKIEEEIKEADAILQSKNVNIEAINKHIQLNEELQKYRLYTKDIHKLLNLVAAREQRK